MGQLRETEVGRIFRIDAQGFDLSANTELTLTFKPATGTEFERKKADGVTAPSVEVDDPTLGVLPANTYYEYPVAVTDTFTAGQWTVTPLYEDATPKKFCGPPAAFSVLPCG